MHYCEFNVAIMPDFVSWTLLLVQYLEGNR